MKGFIITIGRDVPDWGLVAGQSFVSGRSWGHFTWTKKIEEAKSYLTFWEARMEIERQLFTHPTVYIDYKVREGELKDTFHVKQTHNDPVAECIIRVNIPRAEPRWISRYNNHNQDPLRCNWSFERKDAKLFTWKEAGGVATRITSDKEVIADGLTVDIMLESMSEEDYDEDINSGLDTMELAVLEAERENGKLKKDLQAEQRKAQELITALQDLAGLIDRQGYPKDAALVMAAVHKARRVISQHDKMTVHYMSRCQGTSYFR